MEADLDVYQRPYDPECPQVCLDEVSKILRSTPRGYLALERVNTGAKTLSTSGTGNVRFSRLLNLFAA